MTEERQELWLIRHGETEWSSERRHTGRSDIPLTAHGRCQAEILASRFSGIRFDLVLSSPLSRAFETCRLAGYGDVAHLTDDLCEWDYGQYEGRTTADIRKEVPGWSIWTGQAPGGETISEVAGRARKVIERAVSVKGNTLVFAHAHVLRILAACWLGLPPLAGRNFVLDTASLSILGFERENNVVIAWNQDFRLMPRTEVCNSV